MTGYTAITKKRLRGETGSLSYKLATEYGLIAALVDGIDREDAAYTITKATITLAGATKVNLDGPVDVSGALVLDTFAQTGIQYGTLAVPIDVGAVSGNVVGALINLDHDDTASTAVNNLVAVYARANTTETGDSGLDIVGVAPRVTIGAEDENTVCSEAYGLQSHIQHIGTGGLAALSAGSFRVDIGRSGGSDNFTVDNSINAGQFILTSPNGSTTVTCTAGRFDVVWLIKENTIDNVDSMLRVTAGVGTTTAGILFDGSGTLTTGIDLSSQTTLTTGINIGACATTGITFAGGSSYNPIHIGVKSNSADAGLILTGVTDDTGGVMIFADDGGDTLGSVTSPIWARYLLTANQGSGGPTATGIFAQIKSYDTRVYTSGSYTAFKAYNQAGVVTLASGAEYGIINAGMTLAAGSFTVASGTTLSGIDINLGGSGTIANSGTAAALLIRDKGEGATWPRAILVGTSASPLVWTIEEGAINSAIYSNYTGISGFFRGLYVKSSYTPTTLGEGAASVYGIRGHAELGTGATYLTGTGESFCGVHGLITAVGTAFSSTLVTVAGVKGECTGSTDKWTSAKVFCGVWSKMSIGTTNPTGIYTCFYAYAPSKTVDSVIAANGYFTAGMDLSEIDSLTNVLVLADGKGTATAAGSASSKWIVVKVGATTHKIALYNDS